MNPFQAQERERDWLAKEIGKRIKQARVKAGLTVTQLASDFLTNGRIHDLERGESPPTMANLYRIAARLEVDAKDLLP